MQALKMVSTHPDVQGNVSDNLIRCIEECYNCAQVCTTCADACLAEDMIDELRQCIRLNLDCADVCIATGTLASRRTGSNQAILRQMIEACEAACRVCGEECQSHADQHEHCRICAEACERCAEACSSAMQNIG